MNDTRNASQSNGAAPDAAAAGSSENFNPLGMVESPAAVDFMAAKLSDLPVQEATEVMIRAAIEMRASDLLLLSEESTVTVAVKRLGRVEKIDVVTRTQGRQLINLIKANAGLDIADQRRPMDGRWIYVHGPYAVDFRVNSIPTLFGEDVSLRVLDRQSKQLEIEQLGLSNLDLGNLTSMLSSPGGLILVTGPTGAGKTTTLYACLKYLNDGTRKINTLEDPVEYALPGVRQSQVNVKLHLTFSELLRNVLRQAPDVVMVGEIRDEETAITAVRAANSGHLVLATLHAPVAAAAVQSMLALGVKPYFLANCLLGVVAQRLIRSLCTNCRVRYDLSMAPETFSDIKSLLEEGEGVSMYGPGKCEVCYGQGYHSRSGLFEVLTINSRLRKLIAENRPAIELQQAAIDSGMVEFKRGAMLKIARGITSTEEMVRDVPTEYLGLDD